MMLQLSTNFGTVTISLKYYNIIMYVYVNTLCTIKRVMKWVNEKGVVIQ